MSTERLADTNAREAALDAARSFIVQAPAGSGKTELLTNRYLVLLGRVDHPEEVLAITFTRKAAAEMRSRIIEALAAAATGAELEAPHKQRMVALARAALARDAERGWNLLAQPQRLRISTIDALCTGLTRQMPVLSRTGGAVRITEQGETLYREAARELLALLEADHDWTPAVERLLAHLDNDLPLVESLLASMLARRDQWLRHLATPDDPRRHRAVLETALTHAIEDELARAAAALPTAVAAALLGVLRAATANLRAAGSDSALIAWEECVALLAPRVGNLAAWQALAGLLTTSTDGGAWRARVTRSEGFPPPSSAKGKEKARLAAAKAEFEALIAQLAEAPELLGRLRALVALPGPHYADAQWQLIEALGALLPLAVAQLRLIFARHGEVDFTEVSWSALEALGRPEAPSDLALLLDYRIAHLLVDEFQDTSLSQYELLERLTAGWQPDDGRTLFLVGDPMQSIYRFRQAEVGLYLRARAQGLGSVRLTPLALEVNFRSQAGIVDWVNRAFATAFPAEENIALGAVTHAHSVAANGALHGQAVTVHPFFDKDHVAEAEQVAALVQAALADPAQRTIAILVRSRSHLEEIVPRLRAAGIPFRAIDIEPLGGRPVVQDLLVLTRALVHRADRLSWLAVLRAPWCGLQLADLDALCARDRDTAVWTLMQDDAHVARLSDDGQARLVRVRDVLAAALLRERRAPLRQLVEGTWLALGGSACAPGAAALADARAFFDLLDTLEQGGDLADLALLDQQVGELHAAPDVDAGERLQVMTVHKAKGLEFDTVIVPGLGRQPRAADAPLLRWHEMARAGATVAELLLAPMRARGEKQDPVYDFLGGYERIQADFEDTRLLYVASTRAIRHLHLLGAVAIEETEEGGRELREPPARSLLARLWPAAAGEFERALARGAHRHVTATHEAATDNVAIRRLTSAWRTPAPPAQVAWRKRAEPVRSDRTVVAFDWASETIRSVGSLVHRWLEILAREGIAAWSEERVRALTPVFARNLAELGVPADRIGAAIERVSEALTHALTDPRGRWILDSAHGEARTEYALTGVDQGELVSVVLDRTFVDGDGVRWIIDYKTGTHEGGDPDVFLDREQQRYAAQLARYARLMYLLDARPIRLGLYFPLLGAWREWPAVGD
jgi:ATP-dependent helicase/nuclease subunit A